jgi:hypothetical protein
VDVSKEDGGVVAALYAVVDRGGTIAFAARTGAVPGKGNGVYGDYV